MKHPVSVASLAAIAFCLPLSVLAQANNFSPSRPVAVVAPYEPGGPVDIEGRMYTKKATEMTGQQYILDYKTGAGTRIGVGYVAKAPADGHTLLITNSSFSGLPVFNKALPFDIVNDFAPVAHMSIKHSILLVRGNFPARDFVEYVAYARANPGKVNWAMLGTGGTGHLGALWLGTLTKTEPTYIAYKGTGPVLVDMAAGRVDITSTAMSAALAHIRSGKMRAIAIMGNVRAKPLPDVATLAEQGVPEFVHLNWTGFFAPRATPAATLARLNEVFNNVAASADIVASAEAQGNMMVGGKPQDFAQMVHSETARMKKLAQDYGIKPEE